MLLAKLSPARSHDAGGRHAGPVGLPPVVRFGGGGVIRLDDRDYVRIRVVPDQGDGGRLWAGDVSDGGTAGRPLPVLVTAACTAARRQQTPGVRGGAIGALHVTCGGVLIVVSLRCRAYIARHRIGITGDRGWEVTDGSGVRAARLKGRWHVGEQSGRRARAATFRSGAGAYRSGAGAYRGGAGCRRGHGGDSGGNSRAALRAA
jgi:hypothetical protein